MSFIGKWMVLEIMLSEKSHTKIDKYYTFLYAESRPQKNDLSIKRDCLEEKAKGG
jgi:hypothetical protein